ISGGVQWHSRERSLKYPQGQGFMAAASMNRAGNVSDMAARAMHTVPSSSGWRMTSSTLRGNSGSSSKNSTPLWASETSPGRGIRRQRRNAIGAIQQSDNFHQRLHRIDADAGDHCRLAGVGFGHDEVHDLVAARGNGDGQRAAHPAHPAIERKFAHQDVVAQFFFIQRTVGAENSQRHRQVESRTFFLYIRGREVDGDLCSRNIVAAVAQRRADALAALAHRRIGQADGVEVVFRGANAGDIDLNFDDRRVYAVDGGAESLEEHEWRSISEAVVSRQSSVLS